MKRTLKGATAALAALFACQGWAQITVDGTKDALYGANIAVQNTQTGFGDNNDPSNEYANGSELDNVAAYRTATDLYLFIGGNLETNFNKLDIFIDCQAGGDNKLTGGYPDVDFNGLNRMGDDGFGTGLIFDSGFDADYYFTTTCGGTPWAIFANFSDVKTVANGGVGYYLGTGSWPGGLLTGGNNPNGIEVAVNNSNVAGVPAGFGTDPGNGDSVTTGMEWRIPLSQIGNPSGPIKVSIFINGVGHDFISNQLLGGINGGDNVGEPRFADFTFLSGDQYITVPSGPLSFAPSAEARIRGRADAANSLTKLATDDGIANQYCKFIVTTDQSLFVVNEWFGSSPNLAPTSLSATVKSKMANAGSFSQKIEMFDYIANGYDPTDTRTDNVGLAYASRTLNATGTVTRYVRQSDGQARMRVSIRQTGPSTSLFPCTDFDLVNWTVQ